MAGCEIISAPAPPFAHRSAVSGSSSLWILENTISSERSEREREKERERANHVSSVVSFLAGSRRAAGGLTIHLQFLLPPPPPRCVSLSFPQARERSEGIKLKQSGDRSNSAPNKISRRDKRCAEAPTRPEVRQIGNHDSKDIRARIYSG